MIEAFRRRMARRAALDAVVARRAPASGRRPGQSLLLVLPADEAGQRAAWTLVAHLALAPSAIIPVVVNAPIAYAPDAFAGHVVSYGAPDLDWRRLLRRDRAEAVWERAPDIALTLADPDDLSAALLVGASPASVRIGPFVAGDEPFYDLMVKDEPDAPSVARAVRRLLGQVTPPILPLR